MKASEFKNIIKEAVREVIREELSEMSQPTPTPIREQVKYEPTGNAMLDALNETKGSMNTEEYRTAINANSSMAQMYSRGAFGARSAHTPGTEAAIQSAPKVGLDISNLGFLKNAAEIVKVADQKQRQKHGL
jgi:hypothetical protein